MDVSANFAMSLARAAEADAALIQELRVEDQIARDRMIAEAIQDGRRPTVETGYQYPLDDETFNILRQFNTLAIESDDGEEERNTATDGTQNGQEAQQIQLTVHTEEIQDTVVDLKDGTQRFNPEEDLLGTTTADKSANEPQETDSPGTIRIQEQERDHAQNSLTVVDKSAAPAQPTDIVMEQCVSCQDDFPKTFEAPCFHRWCQTCLVTRIEASLRDESLFPPSCCEPLPIEVVDFITQEMVDSCQKKTVELSTVDRTYCSDATCSTFIPPQSIEGDLGRCSACEKQTCVLCKRASHEGICPEDNASQDVLHLGEREGWRRCERCKHLIDLRIGCFHITCPCGHQFCYLCGARWKTCTCPQWEENRLVDAAGQRVVNVRDRARRNLRQARCHHQRCERIDGPRDCDECHQTLQIFLLRCERCDVELCFRCLVRVRAER